MADTVKISSLNIYPVKGCRGISVSKASIGPTGFLYDRNWMIVSAKNGKFQTQRNLHRIALIEVQMSEDAFLADAQLPHDANLTLQAPSMAPLKVPLPEAGEGGPCGGHLPGLAGAGFISQCKVLTLQEPLVVVQVPLRPKQEDKLVEVICWEWQGKAADAGDEAAAWLTRYLGNGKDFRLVRYSGNAEFGSKPAGATRRSTDAKWAPDSETAFSDGFPILAISQASLDDLNNRLEDPLPMNRFRPNIVLDGCSAWAEDGWESFTAGTAEGSSSDPVDFALVKPCDRCKVTTINQATAESGQEPLKTLSTFRAGHLLGWGALPSWKNAVFVGWNLCTKQAGSLAVGDSINITKERTQTPQRIS